MNYGYGYAPSWSFGVIGLFGFILNILFWVLIIVIIVAVIRRLKGRNGCRWHEFTGSSAMNILKERYAKGEISREEFEEKKKDITN